MLSCQLILPGGERTGFSNRISAPDETSPLLKILDIFRLIGVGVSPNLDVALDDRPRHGIHAEHAPLSLAVANPDRESPALIRGMIASLDPATGFIRMVPARPAPEHCPEVVLHAGERSLGDDVSMVVGPTPQQRVEFPDQNRCGKSTAVANHLPGFLQHVPYALSRWLDQQFVSVLAHPLSQEIKSLGDVRDECLFFRESQSAFPEKLDDDRLDFLLQDLLAGRSDHEIIRVTDEVDLVVPGFNGGSDGRFQTIEC